MMVFLTEGCPCTTMVVAFKASFHHMGCPFVMTWYFTIIMILITY
jgi:hypothetical protein